MTTDELLALGEDGVERDLIRGQLRERPLTRRNRRHTRSSAKMAQCLSNWLDQQPEPRGEILVGEAGFRIRKDPDTTVGIDIAYIAPQTKLEVPDDAFIIDALPILAVEILSPSDKQEDILDKVSDYLEAGIPLVWVLEPVFRTVCVYRPGREPELFNSSQHLNADPDLAGFRVSVADLF
jgi:Uma2 family endonuclease